MIYLSGIIGWLMGLLSFMWCVTQYGETPKGLLAGSVAWVVVNLLVIFAGTSLVWRVEFGRWNFFADCWGRP